VRSAWHALTYETMVRLLGDEVVERQPPLALAKLARAVLHLLLRVIHRCRDGDDLQAQSAVRTRCWPNRPRSAKITLLQSPQTFATVERGTQPLANWQRVQSRACTAAKI